MARPRPSKVLRVYSPQEGSCLRVSQAPKGKTMKEHRRRFAIEVKNHLIVGVEKPVK